MVIFLLICLRYLNTKLHELSSAWNPLVPPWLLDQISIICFKKYPYLRSFMLDICTEVLRTSYKYNRPKLPPFSSNKKGDPSLPENFKPINLEPVSHCHCTSLYDIRTSLLQNRVFTYLISNQFIECHHQKGFMPGIGGTFEHIAAEMSHIINYSASTECNH